MKDRLEYRAWDKIDKKMCRVAGIYFSQGRGQVTMEGLKSRRFNNVELMQFTGLLDKNGTKIFEGDIVRSPEIFGESPEHTAIVEYDAPIFYPLDQITGTDKLNCEVIGDIYQNPELLK